MFRIWNRISLALLCLLVLAVPAGAATATIANAWWTNQQDADGDGCFAGLASDTVRLNWDPDVTGGAGSLQVYEKVYLRACGTTAFDLYATLPTHTITGVGPADAQFLDIPLDPNCACFDYLIELYRSGEPVVDYLRGPLNDADLALHREELRSQDAVTLAANIANAWWTQQRDGDGDGCWAGTGGGETARLNWDPEVLGGTGSLTVFERVYYRPCGNTTWLLYATNAPHTISNGSSTDHQFATIEMGTGCACYEYRIAIHRAAQSSPDATRDPANDADLAQRREEFLASDPAPRIRIEPLSVTVNCNTQGVPPGLLPAAAPPVAAVTPPLTPRPPLAKPLRTLVSSQFEKHVITVKFREGLSIRVRQEALTDLGSGALESARDVLASLGGARWQPAYSLTEAQLEQYRQTAQQQLGREIADLNLQLHLLLPPTLEPGTIIDLLNTLDIVELAQPVPKPAPPPLPPNLAPFQVYLTAPPSGINAVGAWGLGTRGGGIRIADVEYSFNTSHQDLPPVTLIGWAPLLPPGLEDSLDHGTAVLGQLGALDNGWGTTGGAPDSALYFSGTWNGSFWQVGSAILNALPGLRPGDVLIIEQQTTGPNYPCAQDQCGLVPVEWYSPWYDAIVTAVGNGIVVVEAAGNGYQNLDDILYRTGNNGHWPFLPANDSGAILVGAGAAPPSSGGSSTVRSRLEFSNHGATVDLQGWGERVYAPGYGGDLGAPNWDEAGIDFDFTGRFGGTSGATPIVASACALVQAAYKSRTGTVLTPQVLKNLLRSTGSTQQSGMFPITQNIGPLPDALTAIQQIVPPSTGTFFRVFNDGAATLTVNAFTVDAPAPWLRWDPQPPFTVAPGGSRVVTLSIDCAQVPVGAISRRVLVSSSDPDPARNPYPGGVFVNVNSSVPSLRIQRSGANVTLSWTAAPPGFVLQRTTTLRPPAWSNAPSGATNPVTLPATNAAAFYRLRRP